MKYKHNNFALKKEAVFIAAVIFYISLVLLFILLMRGFARDYVIRGIDEDLLKAAKTIQYILPDDYHDRAVSPGSISAKEYSSIEKRLTEIASFSGMKYIWTDILLDEKVYLTSCNRTEQTDLDDLKIYYFMPYEDGVSDAQMSAFAGDEPVFTDFKDRWGEFRAVFVPMYSPGGRKYLASAEYTLEYIEASVRQSVMFSISVALFFFFAFIPVLLSYVWGAKIRARELQRKNIELQKSEDNLRITLNSIGDAVIVLDQAGRIMIMNPVAVLLTGWSLKEAAGMPVREILNISDHSTGESINDFVGKIENSGTSGNYILMISRDGTRRIISASSSSIVNSEGFNIGLVIVLRDVTEREKLQNELRQSQKMESLGQLAGGVAHDFNNMLTAIMGSAEILSLISTSDDVRECADTIIDASRKASDLTHKLLAFSRKGIRRNELLDMHNCIRNSVELLRRSIDRKIDMEISLNAGLSIVSGDDTLIENLILNIGINSRDAMPAGGIFSITTQNVEYNEEFCRNSVFDIDPGIYIKIVFQDTGHGIPEDLKEKIFEPFFTTKRSGKGTGLGLYTVYGTVKDHHGLMVLESEEGKGTEIAISLPVSTADLESAGNEIVTEHHGSGGILIVDDEQIVRDTLANTLKRMSYEVFMAADGKEAIETYLKNRGQVRGVFLDMIMPVMNGIEALAEFKKIDSALPVVIISGYTSQTSVSEIVELGAFGFLQKPYKYREIEDILKKIEKFHRDKNG